MSKLNRFPVDAFFKNDEINHRINIYINSQSEKERFSAEKIEGIKAAVNRYLNGGGK